MRLSAISWLKSDQNGIEIHLLHENIHPYAG